MTIYIIYAVFGSAISFVFMLKYQLNVTGFKSRFKKRYRHYKVMITLAAIGIFAVWPLIILFMLLDISEK